MRQQIRGRVRVVERGIMHINVTAAAVLPGQPTDVGTVGRGDYGGLGMDRHGTGWC